MKEDEIMFFFNKIHFLKSKNHHDIARATPKPQYNRFELCKFSFNTILPFQASRTWDSYAWNGSIYKM